MVLMVFKLSNILEKKSSDTYPLMSKADNSGVQPDVKTGRVYRL
jgi:hypothetical protein